MCILSTCPFGSESTGRLLRDRLSRFLNSFSFLKYSGINLQEETAWYVIPGYFKKGKEFLKISLLYLLSALTAKSTGAKNAHNSLNLTAKIGKYTRLYHIFAHVKGTTLPILVLGTYIY